MDRDLENLRLLGVFHFAEAGMVALLSLFPLVHLAVGIGMVAVAFADPQTPLPIPLVGWIFVVFASVWILLGLALASCMVLAGRFLPRRIHYAFCLGVAAAECLFMPLGTALGTFTLILLTRERVRASFGPPAPEAPGTSA